MLPAATLLSLILQCHENLTYCCKCSMLEIYNEVVTDLINPAGTNLQIREDIKRGCYVEDLSEHTVQNGEHAVHKRTQCAKQPAA
jgi:kinesin family protein 15